MSVVTSQNSFESFDQLVNKIRKSGNPVRNQGTLFEYMVQVYLQQAYPEQFSHVWMLKQVPAWTGIPHKDLGVDLVAQDANTNQFIAVQAKFYKPEHKVSKPDTNTFVAELGKKYYSAGIWIASNEVFNANAEKSLTGTSKPITRIGLSELRNANIDWSKFDEKNLDDNSTKNLKKSHKKLRFYQKDAVNKARKYYRNHSRGKLIMAPGTGKTYTSLRIAEALQNDQNKKDFYVLYLVPSIQLLSQTLFSWARDGNDDTNMIKFAVTSDRNATKHHLQNKSDISAIDIGFAATTDSNDLINNYHKIVPNPNQKRMFVIFSTYQSIDVIHQAQEKGYPNFDLIVADEAHRTAGYHGKDKKEGFFTKVHNNNYVHSSLRLYQTATPKIYSQSAKKKSIEDSIVIASMDDPKVFGKTFYYLSFGTAVDYGILTDYKVQVLTVNEKYIDKNMQNEISDPANGISISDIGKIIGTWNAMMKRGSFSDRVYGKPMKRAIAFASVIDNQKGSSRNRGRVGSKQITKAFNQVVNDYLGQHSDDSYQIKVRHADGSMNAMQKKDRLDWLKGDIPDNQARVLSNVKFLGEGIDVPNLDAVIFFASKRSQIDIVQAVGRIMRKYPGKQYGYVILPIVVPLGKDPRKVLNQNRTYKAVWQVLNALRSVDERFDAEVNKLHLKGYRHQKNKRINVIGEDSGPDETLNESSYNNQDNTTLAKKDNKKVYQTSLDLNWGKMSNAIYGEIVKHVGNRRYLEDWSSDVAKIAKRHVNWINLKLRDKNSDFTKAFDKYLISLRHNINDQISKRQAVEMIAQHIITKPVFNALFSNNDFVNNNPVSKAMEGITKQMVKAGFQKEQVALNPFYKSVQMRASGINDANDKQQFIKTLYNEFFSKSFSATTSRLGIVFTPVPIVNFIVHSVDYALHKYFGKSIASKGVNVLDPFVGTGTFITQTLYYLADLWKQHKIKLSDIIRNYTQELYCNEIVLLSYYIAAINIESVFNEIVHSKKYQEFKGIVLTDTFESTERDNVLDEGMFNGNNKRLVNEKNQPITVIISNPPYFRKKKSGNVEYSNLERKIRKTYAKYSTSPNMVSLLNSYIEAIRWASDRIGSQGIIGFVTDARFLNSTSTDGLRRCLYHEFNYLYIYNLRGNQRTSGEISRKEGGKIFGGGSRVPIAISILVKEDNCNNHKIFYKNIGDYLSRTQKFNLIKKSNSIKNIKWTIIKPDKNNDWIDKRNPDFNKYMALSSRCGLSIFYCSSPGPKTAKDNWVYGFSKTQVIRNVKVLINHYYTIKRRTSNINNWRDKLQIINNDKTYVKWPIKLKHILRDNKDIYFHPNELVLGMYRPFTKKWLYYDKYLLGSTGIYYDKLGNNNCIIYTTGRASGRLFSALATNVVPDYHLNNTGIGFMRYDNQKSTGTLLSSHKDNINEIFSKKLGLSTDNTFYYIYGILNSREYKNKYLYNLRKSVARIPIVKNVAPFVKIGKKLMWLHIHYEDVKPYTNLTIQYHSKNPSYHVTKMRHPSPQRKHRDVIKFNSDITIKDIPLKAYKYVVNGKPAIDWILDQYRIKKDKKSGIVDDPNKFSKDPKYIFNLLLKVINVSLKTVDLVNKLPKMQIINPDSYKSINNQKDLPNSSNNNKSAKTTTSEANAESSKSANNINSLNNKIEQLTLKLSSYTNHMNHKGKK